MSDINDQDSVPEGKVVDFIDGKLRPKTNEEYVRQNVERSLVHEYRYLREDIAVEFPIKVGSSRKKADLVIFLEGKRHIQENIAVILECKAEGASAGSRSDGVGQLQSYMASSVNCGFGVWTNGSDERLCFAKHERDGLLEFILATDFPVKGESWADADVPTRERLRPATGDNLLLAFKRCHNYIAGNQGLQKPEAFWELLKVIFSKIEDERSLEPITFYITTREQKGQEGQLKCRKRVAALFEVVKEKYAGIFKPKEEIELDRIVLAFVVAQLQHYSLLDSTVDVKGVAYEEVVGSNLRGDRGEFFTPRNACKMAVEMLDPPAGARIIDPACGTGGFLVTAMNHVLAKFDDRSKKRWKKRESPSHSELREFYRARNELMVQTVVGLDINPNLVRAAKMNMVMNNDGSGGLHQADALKDPITWSEAAASSAKLGSFDFLFTNPPFGTNIRIDAIEVLEQYQLAQVWDWDEASQLWKPRFGPDNRPLLQTSQPPEILFIERALQLLKPGTGKMAIVIPNGILNNPPLGYVRQWLLREAQILAVVDMQRDLFQPRNDTQTSMVCVRRKSDEEKKRERDYPIFMVVTTKIGHDKRGNAIYRRDPDGADILVSKKTAVKVSEKGVLREKQIEEKVPVIDDQLPSVPALFRAWGLEHGV